MSTLQISLAILGIVFLGLVLAYNAWAYRRAAPRKARPQGQAAHGPNAALRQEPDLGGVDITQASTHPAAPAPVGADPEAASAAGQAFDLGKVEPGLEAPFALADAAPLQAQAAHAAGPSVAPAVAAPAAPNPAAPSATPAGSGVLPAATRPQLDALLDAIAQLPLEQPLAGEAILQAQPTTRRAGSKLFQVEGRNLLSGQWEIVRAGQRYDQLQAGVQLANRLGALNEIEFSEFVAKVQTFADSLNVGVELPDMLHEVFRARELDQFASQHDAQLNFMLRPTRAAWSPGYIAQHAGALGFVPAAMPGRMVLPAAEPGLPPLLTLAFDAQAAQAEDLDRTAVYDVLLSLDVPQVAQTQAPFERLCEVLQRLGVAMDGVLCDPDGNPLPLPMLEQIGVDLSGLYAALSARDFAAGSPLARRLFS